MAEISVGTRMKCTEEKIYYLTLTRQELQTIYYAMEERLDRPISRELYRLLVPLVEGVK